MHRDQRRDEGGWELGAKAISGTDDALTEKIIGVYYEVYNELGHGFLESVYCRSLGVALNQAGLHVKLEEAVPVSFRGVAVGLFRADLIVEGRVILELKTADALTKMHEAQLINYLRASPIELGLLLGFGELPRIRRLEFRNSRKQGVAASTAIPS